MRNNIWIEIKGVLPKQDSPRTRVGQNLLNFFIFKMSHTQCWHQTLHVSSFACLTWEQGSLAALPTSCLWWSRYESGCCMGLESSHYPSLFFNMTDLAPSFAGCAWKSLIFSNFVGADRRGWASFLQELSWLCLVFLTIVLWSKEKSVKNLGVEHISGIRLSAKPPRKNGKGDAIGIQRIRG